MALPTKVADAFLTGTTGRGQGRPRHIAANKPPFPRCFCFYHNSHRDL